MPKIKEMTITQLQKICEFTECLDCPLEDKGCWKNERLNCEDYREKNIDLNMIVYQKLCVGCESEKYCHVNCGTCPQYDETLIELEGE